MLRVLLYIGLISSSPLLAYGPCDEDIEKLCSKKFHGETARTCLHEQVEKLSADCKQFVLSRHDKWKERMASFNEIKSTCNEEMKTFCSEEQNSRKPLMVCFMMYGEKLSTGCRNAINEHIDNWMPNIKKIEAGSE